MNVKPAAIVFTDAAGQLSGEVVNLVDGLEQFRRITHGLEKTPPGAVTVQILSARGIEKRHKVGAPEPQAKPAKAKT